MEKKTKKLLLASGAGLAVGGILAAGAYHKVTKLLMRIAMDREEPKTMTKAKKQLMGSKDNKELVTMLHTAAHALEEKVTEEIEITAHDGIRLVGHWWPCENAKRIIVAMHGWRSSWSQDFGIIADFWHDSGCSILFAEQRGQNKSGGDYMGFGLIERYDCREWINWVNTRTGESLPIYLGGVSMGATTILMTAGLDLPGNVAGIVADCGFISPYAIWEHVVKNNLHMSYGPRSAAANDLCRKKIQIGANDYSTTDALRTTNIPILFIHGTDDHFVPIEMTYENYKACVSEKRLLVVPGAEHAMSYLVDKEGYENAIRSFWKDFDAH